MNPNIKPSNRGVLAAAIDPDAYAPSTITSGWVSLATYGYILAALAWGDLGTGATINAKLQQASDSGGTGAKDISGKAITEVDQTDSPIPANQQAVINCRSDELDVANSFTHVRLSVTITSTSSPLTPSDVCAMIFGYDANYQPATDATTVAEAV